MDIQGQLGCIAERYPEWAERLEPYAVSARVVWRGRMSNVAHLLIMAFHQGDLDILRAALEMFPQMVNSVNGKGQNLLHVCFSYRRSGAQPAMELLLEMGCNGFTQRDTSGRHPMEYIHYRDERDADAAEACASIIYSLGGPETAIGKTRRLTWFDKPDEDQMAQVRQRYLFSKPSPLLNSLLVWC